MHSLKDTEEGKKDWVQVPQSKNRFLGRFEVGSASHLNQHVKLRQKTKFRVYNLHCLEDMEEDQKRTGYRYPSLKIAFGGIFQVGSASHLN